MISQDDFCQHLINLVSASGTAGLGNNYNRLLASLVKGDWNADLRVKVANPHKGKLHSWMASVLTEGQKRQGARMNHYWGVRLRGILWTWDNGDNDNSEKYLRAELKAIKTHFANRNDLDLDQQATGYLRHDEIQVTNNTIQHAGNGSAHVVNLFLGCYLHEMLTSL